MNDEIWNPWHGCHKYSEGCANCYMFRRDESVGRATNVVDKTASFDLPIRKDRHGNYKLKSGIVFACMTSDFFVEDADAWRAEAWRMIRERQDIRFFIITKRIARFETCVPPDWGSGYPNVTVCCTIENQRQCDIRFPILNKLPIVEKRVCLEPLLSEVNMRAYLTDAISQVIVGGESGGDVARVCNYDWVTDIREQCIDAGVRFYFKQTGSKLLKDGKLYFVERRFQHSQAKKANINFPQDRHLID